MQKVGKSDETKDEVFDEFVSNFSKQQVNHQVDHIHWHSQGGAPGGLVAPKMDFVYRPMMEFVVRFKAWLN